MSVKFAVKELLLHQDAYLSRDSRDVTDVHSEDEEGDQAEVHRRHDPALLRSDFEVTPLDIALLAEKGEEARQGGDENKNEQEIGMHDCHDQKNRESDQPHPWRKRGNDAAAIEETNGHEIEQV